jgi:GTP-binding protein Era
MRRRHAVRVRRHAGLSDPHGSALNKSLNKTVMGAIDGVDLVLFVVEAGSFTLADAKVLSLLKPGTPTLLVANKLDTVHRRAELAPWLKSMQERHPFAEFVPMSAKNPRGAAAGGARPTCPSSPGGTARTS